MSNHPRRRTAAIKEAIPAVTTEEDANYILMRQTRGEMANSGERTHKHKETKELFCLEVRQLVFVCLLLHSYEQEVA